MTVFIVKIDGGGVDAMDIKEALSFSSGGEINADVEQLREGSPLKVDESWVEDVA